MVTALKNILYALALLLLVLACYFGYDWYLSDPENKEPLPALLSFGSSLIALLIAWLSENNTADKNNVTVGKIEGGALVDVDT